MTTSRSSSFLVYISRYPLEGFRSPGLGVAYGRLHVTKGENEEEFELTFLGTCLGWLLFWWLLGCLSIGTSSIRCLTLCLGQVTDCLAPPSFTKIQPSGLSGKRHMSRKDLYKDQSRNILVTH